MQTIIASIIAFITTNVDDIFILVLFFSNSKFRRRNVIAGQYLGIGALIALSFIGSFVALVIDLKYIGMLGLVPIYIGLKGLVDLVKHKIPAKEELMSGLTTDATQSHVQQIFSVASVTIANGGDNISIYTPLYATLTSPGKAVMTVVFLLMTAVWCLVAGYVGKHPLVQGTIERYGYFLTPFVFILLGVYIIYESRTFTLFF